MTENTRSDRWVGETWPRPTIVPLPLLTRGVTTPLVYLNGVWKLNIHPSGEFWSNTANLTDWADVEVPGYLPTQGVMVDEGQEYAFRCRMNIPPDFAGKRILLRFDGVNCLARVWVNEKFVRSHYGGYTSWNCDITDLVRPGEATWLTVGVTDKQQEISSFHSGGIHRDVCLVAVPEDYLSRLHVETQLDAAYQDAVLKVTAGMTFHQGDASLVQLNLLDPNGKPVEVGHPSITLTGSTPEASLEIPLVSPKKWDAEHPRLYTLQANLVVDGVQVETLSKKVGFRKIEVVGNRMLVNGQEVKLRGVNRHDTHPLTGRTVTPELVEQDVMLFRAANVNFIRTSHYPPREDFLETCDRLGMYVEDEIAVAFVYQFIQPTQDDPAFTAAYMNQFAEMIERDRSHASVILWSLANESYWGRNFKHELDYVRKADPTRPTIFSYPITIPDGEPLTDIWSLHYAENDCDPADRTDNFTVGKAWGHSMPVLHDEVAHIPCYNLPELMRDPGVREFWGESIRRFWENIFTTPGALGGAIWAGIDDTLITHRGYAVWEWGIFDGWRRPKPEYWLTQKAYSPIRVDEKALVNPGAENPARISVRNWFDHTNLNEITIHWQVADQRGVVAGPNVSPHGEGWLEIAPRDWRDGETLNLKFFRMGDILVDEVDLMVGERLILPSQLAGPAPTLRDDADALWVVGADFSLAFSKETGLVTQGIYQGVKILTGGPYLNLVGVPLQPWALERLARRVENDEAVIDLLGSYGPIRVQFEVRVDGQGLITTRYTLIDLPVGSPRARKFTVGLDVGGYREVGVAYTLSPAVDRLSWNRTGLWSVYPQGHIGRPRGTALKFRPMGDESFGAVPGWPWAEDMRNYSLFGKYDVGGRGTKDFTSMKHSIWRAAALLGETGRGLCAVSNGQASVRLELVDHPEVKIDDRSPALAYSGSWQDLDANYKNYCGTERVSNQAGDSVEYPFTGTGVCWMGAKDLINGQADVFVDGVQQAAGIDLYSGIGLGTSRGEEKVYQQVLFSIEGLPDGQHTIRVVVTGQKNRHANNCYVSIDAFIRLGAQEQSEVRFNINNAWNYPELTWGNYVKPPVLIGTGYANSVQMRFVDAGSADYEE